MDTYCEICETEVDKTSECRSCKTKCCGKCYYGGECTDCMADKEDDMRPSRPSRYDY